MSILELCIDTSAGASVAIVREGKVLSSRREDNPRRHAEDLAVLIQQAAEEAGILGPVREAGWARVCVGTGPAPYTGLRAGLVTAEVFAAAANVPVYGVSSLDVVARSALDVLPAGGTVIAVTDARRKEVYWARYRATGPDGVERLTDPAVSKPGALAGELRREDAVLVGPGAHLVQEKLGARMGPVDPGGAAVLSRLVASGLSSGAELGTAPMYLRRPDIN